MSNNNMYKEYYAIKEMLYFSNNSKKGAKKVDVKQIPKKSLKKMISEFNNKQKQNWYKFDYKK